MITKRKEYLAVENSFLNARKTLLQSTDKDIALIQKELKKSEPNNSQQNENQDEL